jgi:predicted MFS family arabinose efflux permease
VPTVAVGLLGSSLYASAAVGSAIGGLALAGSGVTLMIILGFGLQIISSLVLVVRRHPSAAPSDATGHPVSVDG